MIHLYTGEGKGKTTAAAGLCIRAAGQDYRVCFAQFMKGNDTGELHVLRALPNVEILRSEKNFGFYSAMSEVDKEELTDIHNRILDRLHLRGMRQCTLPEQSAGRFSQRASACENGGSSDELRVQQDSGEYKVFRL